MLFRSVPREPEPVPGAFDFDLQLRNLLNRAIKESPKSRAEIAAAMTDLVFGDAGDGEITKVQLDSWTAPSRGDWRFPLCYLPAFVKAADAVWLLDKVAAMVGCKVLVGSEALDAELGRIQRKMAELKRRERAVKKVMGGRR